MKLVEITKDDFKNYSGIDLELEFANGNYDTENMPEIFIDRVQNNLINYLKSNYPNFKNKLALNDNELCEKDKVYFFEALLPQINYVLRTNDITNICNESYNILKGSGLINRYNY